MPHEIDTPAGLARAHLLSAAEPVAALVLGHGAGGSIGAPDLRAATEAALETGFSVVLVEQPYLVAGRRSPPRAPRLDAAWIAVLAALRGDPLRGLRVATGGRSSGARVACRTARATGAQAVVCLAFPLEPPGGRASRLAELEGAGVPVLVVQGERDPFGMPPPGPGREVVAVPGDHGLKRDPAAVAAAVRAWLPRVLP